MKNGKKVFTTIAVLALAVVVLILCFNYSHRELSFLEILPEIQGAEAETVKIMRNDAESPVSMPKELFDEFLNEMDQFRYQHAADGIGMDSFGTITYSCNGKKIELMFSNERGGSILVNPVDTERKEPIYKVTGNGQLEEIFDRYAGLAEGMK